MSALVALGAGLAHGRAEPGARPPGRARRGGRAADQPDGAVPQARSRRPPRRARRDRPAARHRRSHRLRPWRQRHGGRIAHHVRVAATARSSAAPRRLPRERPKARDPLTGAARRPRGARLDRAASWPGARRGAPALVVLLLSVSRFDTINAAFGRATGDAVLQAAARRIERHVGADARPKLVARMAGAEFAVLLGAPATPRRGPLPRRPAGRGDRAAVRCRATMSSPSAAAPASPRPSPATIAASLLRRASARARRGQGGDGWPVRVLDEGAESATARGDRLEVDLRRALDQDEIEILLPAAGVDRQPARSSASRRSPAGGTRNMASSARVTLFSVAERSDYLAQLSDHVQRKAIAAAAAWPESLGELRLSVNITAADIVRPGFAAQFLALVAESGFDAGAADRRGDRERADRGSRRRRRPARASCAAAAFASRSTISAPAIRASPISKALPLDYLKIDKRLVRGHQPARRATGGGAQRDRHGALARASEVIAEGVETEEQLACSPRRAARSTRASSARRRWTRRSWSRWSAVKRSSLGSAEQLERPANPRRSAPPRAGD